jgi:hypothetical protein
MYVELQQNDGEVVGVDEPIVFKNIITQSPDRSWNLSTSKLTCPFTGVYILGGVFRAETVSNYIKVYVNGVFRGAAADLVNSGIEPFYYCFYANKDDEMYITPGVSEVTLRSDNDHIMTIAGYGVNHAL